MLTLAPMRSTKGTIRFEAGPQRVGVAAEPLDGLLAPLRHRLDAHDNEQNRHHHDG